MCVTLIIIRCVFVGEIIVCVSCHKCHHVHSYTCNNDVPVPCNMYCNTVTYTFMYYTGNTVDVILLCVAV